MSLKWGVASTVQAPAAQVLAFVSWYLDLGASRIWLHFDDPDDPAARLFDGCAAVQVVRCHEAYWGEVAGRRPDTHQQRQSRNITRVLRRTALPWVLHVDVDEFLQARRPVGDLLQAVPPEQLILRTEPWEALHAPELADDIFTARHFRRALPAGNSTLAVALYGPEGALLERGMLSHTVGKCFFRSRVPGLQARIHGARRKGEVVPGGSFHPALALLHFHAENRQAWLERLPFRLSKGAYQFRPQMQAWLRAASPLETGRFYDQVQRARPELLAALESGGFLSEVSLGLRARVARHFPQAF